MPIRGAKNPMPMKGGKPTGIFSSKGKQKADPVTGDHVGLKNSALKTSGSPAQTTSGGKQSLRHQAPKRK